MIDVKCQEIIKQMLILFAPKDIDGLKETIKFI